MPTYPATRRFFLDDEFRNENAAIAGVVRAIALGQNYRYARDLKVTPSDAKVYGEASWPWNTSLWWSPVRNFGSGVGYYAAANVAEIVVPDPRSPASRIDFYAYVYRPATGAVSGTISVTNRTTGEVTTGAVDNSAASYWVHLEVPASPGDLLRLSATWASGTAYVLAGYTAWWSSTTLGLAGATFSPGWYGISQSHCADGRPLHTALLKWIGQSANQSAYHRPQVVAASWLYNPAAGTNPGYSSYPTVVGRYQLPIGGRIPSLTVRVRYRASGACTITAALSGGDSGTITIGGAGTSVQSTTITLSATPGSLGMQELTLTVNGSPAYCDVEWVGVWENHGTAVSLALPAAETVPANFDPNLDERMGSGLAIRSDDIARLVANEVWLWAYRRDRVLVNDCRFTYREGMSGLTFTGAGGLTDRSALHELRTSKVNAGDAFGELKVRAGWYQGSGTGRPTPWEAWRFQVGVASLADYAGSPAVGCEVQSYDYPDANWASFEQSSWQHARGGALAGDTTYLLETVLLTAGHTSSIGKTTRPSWLTVEELPLNSPARTYP